MRVIISLLALLVNASWASISVASGPVHGAPPPDYAPDRVLVKFFPGTPGHEIRALAKQARANSLKVIPGIDVHVMRVPAGSVMAQIALFEHNPNVLFVEPDFNRILYLPNEGDEPEPTGTGNDYFHEQWALTNTGQVHTQPDLLLGAVPVTGAVDADIDAPEGWDFSTGNSNVKIAIIDTGIDCRSDANPGGSLEFLSPDKCVEQVSFVTGFSTTLEDVASHGTHVAGIAAAKTDNDIGIAGVGFDSSVGNLKACFEYTYDLLPPIGYYVTVGVCPVSASADAITYAANNGYQVINMSYASDAVDESGEPLGLAGPSDTELSAVNYAWEQGVVLVAAAGNNNDTNESYPAAYDNVIAVGATDRYDDRASFSTFGDWVSLLAPGENIISTVPNELCAIYADILVFTFNPDLDACLDWYSGTSMASPHVAGAAALVWNHLFGAMSPASCTDSLGNSCNVVVRQRLENGADKAGALDQNMLAWSQHGRLNLVGALTNTTPSPPPEEVPPAPPANFVVSGGTDGTATLTWTDESDNEDAFEIERETQHPKNGKWVNNTLLAVEADVQELIDAVGDGDHQYRLRAVNPSGSSDWSGWSQVLVTGESSGDSGNGKDKPCRGAKCP